MNMKLLNSQDIVKLLSQPLAKHIDQKLVEQWTHSLWSLTKVQEKVNNQQAMEKGVHHRKPFTMMLPPPNVTGNLHLGHALTFSIEDAIVRHRRIANHDTKWIPGFDHAGLATQSIVEKLLWHQKKLTRLEFGRERFIEFANEWKDSKRNEMRQQLERMGLDLDYEKEFFTTDPKSSYAVQISFKKLFAKGLIYRDTRPVYWSKELNSTLSDIEVTINEKDGARYIRTNEKVETRDIPQWFINCDAIARKAVKLIENSSIEMLPKNYKSTWNSWLLETGITDWCISRQSWWGHQIPAYKMISSCDDKEAWVVADSIEEARNLLQSQDIMQDADVLDTWFSSSLLPLTISGWPDEQAFATAQAEGRFPLDIMETGFDILTFWVTKMVMMSVALEDRIPFKLILLHGMICDGQGKKMSKSKGNVIDPNDLIQGSSLTQLHERTRESCEQGLIDLNDMTLALKNQKKLFPNGIPGCGADGLRGYLLSQDFQEEVVRVQMAQIDKVRRLMKKLWSIFRFTMIIINSLNDKASIKPRFSIDLAALEKEAFEKSSNIDDYDDLDRKLIQELTKCLAISEKCFNSTYKIHHLFTAMESFWISQVSSQYLPHIRSCMQDDQGNNIQIQKRKLQVLVTCLAVSARIFHPIMPHITEFLYQKLHSTCSSQHDSIGPLIADDSIKFKL